MNRTTLLIFLIPFFSFFLAKSFAQKQFADLVYDINATIDTTSNNLDVQMSIEFTNLTSFDLDTVFINVWQNAFSDKLSAYSLQKLNLGFRDFYFLPKKNMGGYENLTILHRGNKLTIYQYKDNPDIIYFLPPSTLPTNEKINLICSYTLKIPKLLDRSGRNNSKFLLTYWHPTISAIDENGWHPMPYLLLGEGYLNPAEYNVNFDTKGLSYIASGNSKSTQNGFTSQLSHGIDFAIALSKKNNVFEYNLNNSGVKLSVMSSSKKRSDLIKKYSEGIISYMEKNIASFPVSNISIVDMGAKASSGMEYSGLVTVSGEVENGDLEYYVIHELLHQYFYHSLASNQRTQGYFDEGLTTYYQQRYYKDIGKKDHYNTKTSRFLSSESPTLLHRLAETQAQRHLHVPLNSNSKNIAPMNYGMNAYEIPAELMNYLENYLTREVFDSHIQQFYNAWQNKNPHFNDFLKALSLSPEEIEMVKSLFQNEWSFDFKLKTLNEEFCIIEKDNDQPIKVPIKLSHKNGDTVIWPLIISKIDTVHLDRDYSKVIIDPEHLLFDINRNNNFKGVKRPIKPIIGVKLDEGKYRELFILPFINYNTSDGLQLGSIFWNSSLPSKKLKWLFAPSYSLEGRSLVYDSWLKYDVFNRNSIDKLQFSISSKSFHYSSQSESLDPLKYYRINPKIEVYKNRKKQNPYSIYAEYIFLDKEYYSFREEDIFTEHSQNHIFRLGANYTNHWTLSPMHIHAFIEQQSYRNIIDEDNHYLKFNIDIDKSFFYGPEKKIDFRVWTSYFILNSRRNSSSYLSDFTYGSSSLINQGFTDYAFDEYFINRENQFASFDNQIGQRGGGFKTTLGSQNNIGFTNDFAFAVNVESHLPINTPKFLPLRLFFDFGYYTTKPTETDPLIGNTLVSGGIALNYFDFLKIYLPLFNSAAINEIYEIDGISTLGRVSFSINLAKYNPFKLVDETSRFN